MILNKWRWTQPGTVVDLKSENALVGPSAQCQCGGVERYERQATNGVLDRKTLPSGDPATDAVVWQNVLAMMEM